MSEERDEAGHKGFKVTDRRAVAGDEAAASEPQAERAEPAAEEPPESGAPQAMPDIDFSTFIFSLSTSVMVHLGEVPGPDGSSRKDLVLAKQAIDIISLLKEKTQGNLTGEEEQLLEELLYDLRLRFVAAAR